MRLILSSLLLAATIVTVAASDGDGRQAVEIGSDPYPRWPAETLVDWAGFADQVSIVSIVSERELPRDAHVRSIGSGYVGREVIARVESTLWRRPDAPSVAGDVPIRVSGWTAHEHQLRPVLPYGGWRLEVGDRLVAPLLRAPESEWGLLSDGVAIRLAGGRAQPTAGQLLVYPSLAPTLKNKSVGEIADLLAGARPHPLVASHSHLDADARRDVLWNALLESG